MRTPKITAPQRSCLGCTRSTFMDNDPRRKAFGRCLPVCDDCINRIGQADLEEAIRAMLA